MTLANAYGDILIGSRANDVESSMKRLAGSTHVGVAREALPCSYMIVPDLFFIGTGCEKIMQHSIHKLLARSRVAGV